MADPVLSETIGEDENAFIDQLLETHGPRQVAAAFARLYRAGRSAPEDLIEVSIEERKPRDRVQSGENFPVTPRRPREEFGPSRWFSLSVGRKQSAEPRWLIPMLCRAGDITKNEIGAIKMQMEETYVELSAASADGFLKKLGPNRMLEKGIRLTPIEGQPDLTNRNQDRQDRQDRPKFDRPKPMAERAPDAPRYDKKPKKPFSAAPASEDRSSERPAKKKFEARPQGEKPTWEKKPGKFAKNKGDRPAAEGAAPVNKKKKARKANG